MMEDEGVKAAVVARVVTMIVALNWTMFVCLLYDMWYRYVCIECFLLYSSYFSLNILYAK